MLKLCVLQVLYVYIAVSSIESSFSNFKCIDSPGRTPGILDVIEQFGPLINSTPTAIGISAIQCASLCNPLTDCQSYSYNPVNRHCFTRNITLEHRGISCGIPINESQQKCQQSGDTFIAYGGRSKTMLECICGAIPNNEIWVDRDTSSIPRFDCSDRCKNWYPCAVYIGVTVHCDICNATVSACEGGTPTKDTNPKRLICMPIPPLHAH